MDSKLADFERAHQINERWLPTDRVYLEARTVFLTEKREQLRASLWAAVIKRHYLLRMKARYAGMY